MATFRLVLPKAPWLSCLEELRLCYGWALRDAGHVVTYADTYLQPSSRRVRERLGEDHTLAFGAHAVPPPLSCGMIIANSEHHARHFTSEYLDTLRCAALVMHMGPFDNSVPLDDDEGPLSDTVECPPGILSLDRVVEHSPLWVPGGGRSIDVLHYGSVTPRRARIFEALSKAGIQVTALYGVLGEKRDWYIDRAKVVLDLKQEGDEPDDQTRAWWALSRGACVLSENAPIDTGCLFDGDDFEAGLSLMRVLLADAGKREGACREYVQAIGECDVSPLLKALGL